MRTLIAILILFTVDAHARSGELRDAKAQGLVCEERNGYVRPMSREEKILKLVERINHKRRLKYEKIAESEGSTVHEVERIAGEKQILRAGSGVFVENAKGVCVKK